MATGEVLYEEERPAGSARARMSKILDEKDVGPVAVSGRHSGLGGKARMKLIKCFEEAQSSLELDNKTSLLVAW
jgi:hypothetical protein